MKTTTDPAAIRDGIHDAFLTVLDAAGHYPVTRGEILEAIKEGVQAATAEHLAAQSPDPRATADDVTINAGELTHLARSHARRLGFDPAPDELVPLLRVYDLVGAVDPALSASLASESSALWRAVNPSEPTPAVTADSSEPL